MPRKVNSDNNKVVKSVTKKSTAKKNNSISKKKTIAGKKLTAEKEYIKAKKDYIKREKINNFLTVIVILFFGVLLIFSTYAWLSTALNVKVRNFTMKVSQNSGLTISLDGITFSSYVDISSEILIDQLVETYPNNTSQWAGAGLIPVSSPGIRNSNMPTFDVYASGGVRYKGRKKENGFVTTQLVDESERTEFNRYIAFDIFLKNQTGSPVSDNLYLNELTYIEMQLDVDNGILDEEDQVQTPSDDEYDDNDSDGLHNTEEKDIEEMRGLVNSVRLGLLKIGTVPIKSSVETIQNVQCNNNCQMVIYEPHSTNHTALSITRAKKFDVYLEDGVRFPTFAFKKEGGPIYIKNAVSGSPFLDPNFFVYQETIKEEDLVRPIFELPDGITKVRVYLWVEGQDIDSLETNSHGAELAVSIDLSKDTHGYTSFN